MARIVSRPPASRLSERHHSPSEVAGILAAAKITLSARRIQQRCRLPVGDPLRIATNPAHPGRDWIPERELMRLLGVPEVSA